MVDAEESCQPNKQKKMLIENENHKFYAELIA